MDKFSKTHRTLSLRLNRLLTPIPPLTPLAPLVLCCLYFAAYNSLIWAQENTPNTTGQLTDQESKQSIDESTIVHDENTANTSERTQGNETNNSSGDEQQKGKTTLAPAELLAFDLSKQEALLAVKLPQEHVTWLMTEEQKFLGVWHPEHSRQPKGAVLILPHQDISVGEQTLIADLQQHLAANGWSNLTISLPKSITEPHPQRPTAIAADAGSMSAEGAKADESKQQNRDMEQDTQDTSESKGESTSENDTASANNSKTMADDQYFLEAKKMQKLVRSQSHDRILRGLGFLQEKNQYNNVIISIGSSAERVLNFIHALQNSEITVETPTNGVRMSFPLRGVVLVNLHHKLDASNKGMILNAIKKIPIPVLDVYNKPHLSPASDYQLQFAQARKNVADIADIPVFIQRSIQPDPIQKLGEHRMSRVIRGFLHQYAEGVEDEKRR